MRRSLRSTSASATRALVLLLAVAMASAHAEAQKKKTAPEVFNARASVASDAGRGDAYITIRVDRYSADKDLKVMEKALKEGGSSGFVQALRQSPVVGRFEVGTQTFAIRWARERDTDRGRVITLVTEKPVYFVGGGLPGAKSREGFDVAVIQLNVDTSGLGEGTMAAAAQVKPGEQADVDVDAYSGDPIKLLSIMRKVS